MAKINHLSWWPHDSVCVNASRMISLEPDSDWIRSPFPMCPWVPLPVQAASVPNVSFSKFFVPHMPFLPVYLRWPCFLPLMWTLFQYPPGLDQCRLKTLKGYILCGHFVNLPWELPPLLHALFHRVETCIQGCLLNVPCTSTLSLPWS